MSLGLGFGLGLRRGLSPDARILRGLFARTYVPWRDGTMSYSGGALSGAGATGTVGGWDGALRASGVGIYHDIALPGVGMVRGYHAQGARTNLFLNSAAPATQSITVGTGSVSIYALGSGYTLTSSAGTATGSGFGAVTMGTAHVLTITGAGTITLTVSGTPASAAVRVEQAPFPGLYIPTAGAAVSRTADLWTWDMSAFGGLSATAGEVFCAAVPYLWSAGAGAAHPSGVSARIFSSTADADRMERSNVDSTAKTDGGTQTAAISSLADASGVSRRLSSRWDNAGLYLYRGGSLAASDVSIVPPWNSRASMAIGNIISGTPDRSFFGLVFPGYVPGGMTDAERAALSRLFPASVGIAA